MAITNTGNPNKNLLERLKKDNIDVRINYIGEKFDPYLGKINEITNQDVFLLPYAVWEPVPTPSTDKFLSRYRIETEYPKILPLMHILSEPLSKDYIEDFIKLQNYFSSLVVSNKKLRDILFDRKFYLMPSEDEIKSIRESLIKPPQTPRKHLPKFLRKYLRL